MEDDVTEDTHYFVVTDQTAERSFCTAANFWTRADAEAFAAGRTGWYGAPATVGKGVLRLHGTRPSATAHQ